MKVLRHENFQGFFCPKYALKYLNIWDIGHFVCHFRSVDLYVAFLFRSHFKVQSNVFILFFLVSQNGLERIQYGKKEEEPIISNSTHDNKSVSSIHSRKSSSLGYALPIAFSAR